MSLVGLFECKIVLPNDLKVLVATEVVENELFRGTVVGPVGLF
jgi:hypothetical protein